MDALFAALVFLAIIIAVMVAISRWVFRINEIVDTLHTILAVLAKEKPAPK